MADETDNPPSASPGGEESERARESLRSSETRYRRLFEAARDGILIVDTGSRKITDVNPFMSDLLGYPPAELLGKELWEIGLLKDAEDSRAAFRELEQKGYIRYEHLPLQSKDGTRREVEFVSNIYAVEGHQVIQCNIRDITERKYAEEAKRKSHDELTSLVAELRRRESEMQLLNRMNDLLQSCNTQEEAYKVIALLGRDLFPGQNGGVAVWHAAGLHLETVARWGDETLVQPAFPLEDCWALRLGSFHEITDPQVGLCRHFVHQIETDYSCAPLMVQGEILGLLCLVGATAGGQGQHHLSQRQLTVMVGESIKLCLSNLKLREKLHAQAIHDPLTGLFNRRYLEDTLSREVHRAHRRSSPLGVAMLDLDHFKQFNDEFGHVVGDSLLRELGRLLGEKLRKSDISCRYGGEEFVLIFPDSSLADTQRRVEEIRGLIKGVKIRHGDQLLGAIAVSAGVAGAPEHGSTAAELLRAADNAMYAAKQAGRDRVVVYEAKPS
jgi:diguanylate cyclase (GGDEF)-like protein/PAS domain S-box-containing protein